KRNQYLSWNGVKPGSLSASTNVSKNQVTCARCHFVGDTSGIDCTVWSSGDSGAASSSVLDRTSADRRTSASAVHGLVLITRVLRPRGLGAPRTRSFGA